MLTIEECADFSGLDTQLLEALAQHEQIPVIVAASLAASLLQTPRGLYRIHTALLDEMERAWNSGDHRTAKLLDQAYSGFRSRHPMPRVIT